MSNSHKRRSNHLEAIGKAVREVRMKHNLTQEQVGHELGLTQKDFSRIERGEHAVSIERFWQVATALDIEPSKLLQIAETINRASEGT